MIVQDKKQDFKALKSSPFYALLTIVVMLLVAAPPRSAARPTSTTEAGDAARAWLKHDPAPLGAPLDRPVTGVRTFSDGVGEAAFHVIDLEPEGFIIVAGDDLLEPIVLFSAAGHFDPSTKNPMGALVARDLPARVGHVRTKVKGAQGKGRAYAPDTQESKAREKWSRLRLTATTAAPASEKTTTISDVRVTPFIQSRWNQETAPGGQACYNYYTPPGSSGSAGNYPAGCVATAMAQLMRYFQYPTQGVGTDSFEIIVDGKITSRKLRGGNGAGGAYAWSNMPLVPTSSITSTQRQAIGALTADAGVSVGMDYAKDGSGATLYETTLRLRDTFLYTNAIHAYANGDSIPTATLYKMINPNLDAKLPVLLGIMESFYSGHAVVCDGYGYNLATMYHHLNMGWSGYDDAWYNLPTVDGSAYYFSSTTEVLYNVYVSGTGEIISGRVTDAAGQPLSGVLMTARKGTASYTATTNSRGIYALAKLPTWSQYTISASKGGYYFTSQTTSTGLSRNESSSSGNVWGLNFKAAARKNAAQGWSLYSAN